MEKSKEDKNSNNKLVSYILSKIIRPSIFRKTTIFNERLKKFDVLKHPDLLDRELNILYDQLGGLSKDPQTFSICKSDFLITGEDPNAIQLGTSLSADKFQGQRFDYMATNPPFGVSWKSEQEFVKSEAANPNGRFSVGTPRSSDGSLLFLQHLISKMEPKGSRIGIVFNGSPLFTGDAGSGERVKFESGSSKMIGWKPSLHCLTNSFLIQASALTFGW